MAHHPAAVAIEAAPVVIPQGADFSIGWIFAEGDPPEVPEDWPDDWSASLEIRETRGGALLGWLHSSDGEADGTLALDTVAADGIAGVEDEADVATITAAVPGAASAEWTWTERPYPFDLELSGPGGRLMRLVEGTVILSQEVTTGE